MNNKELLVIIPAYNEEKNIGALLERLEQPEIERIADILVINDGSKDRTGLIARASNHIVVDHVFNLGYGSGLQSGYKYALRHGYRYVIQIDGDGQHDVGNIAAIYERLKKKDERGECPDVVLGSRFLKDSVSFPVSFAKKVGFVLFRRLIYMGTGRHIKDPTTGLWGLDKRVFSFYAGYSRFDDRYPDANKIMEMLLLGFRVEEIPAVMHPRTEGVSMHSGLKPFVYVLRMLFSIVAVWIRIKLFHIDTDAVGEERN